MTADCTVTVLLASESMGVRTMNEIENYFNQCVAYWMGTGVSKGVATVRAIWWDCVEVWNADKSWDANKIEFINRWRKYKPYDPVPESELVESGNA